jgi:DNA-binding transcriptional MerR regulator
MALVRTFHKYRGMATLGMSDLLAILTEQLPLVAPRQTRYRVTDLPTARTIRFYTAQGLVDKPSAREGTSAVYGYRHLLQLLAIKYLQSQYLPLVKVRSLVSGASNRDLELLIPEIAPAVHRGIEREDRRLIEQLAGRAPQPAPGSAPAAPAQETSAAAPETAPDTWHRVEVAPGIELLVHTTALPLEERERLRGALLRELARARGWGTG